MISLQSPIKRNKPIETTPVAQLATGGATDTNPRKVQQGTSYQAKGLIQPPNLDVEDGSSQPVRVQEVVPELVSPFQRAVTYSRMLNDAGVDVSVRIVKTPVLGAEFFVEPYSDDPNDVMIAQFIWENLAGGMSAPFLNSLEDILHIYEDGYSTLEKVYEMREWSGKSKGANTRQYTMLKKLGVRPSTTIKQIDYDDNGGPNGLVQTAIRSGGKTQDVPIDINKLLIFTFNRRGGDVTGKSILRTAYPHWYYKTHMYKIDAIQKERHSLGVPRGKLMQGFLDKDRSLLRTLLRNLRSNHESFVVEPPNIEIDFIEVKGQLVDVLKSAEHHNTMILLNVMAQFMALGIEQGSGGGRSTAGGQIDMFMKSLRFVANYIADVINMYLIPELVVWNFPTTNFPKLSVRNIGETRDLQMLAAAVANLLAQGAVEMDDPTESWMRRIFDMPAKDPSTVRVKPGVTAVADNANSNATGGTNNNGKGAVKPSQGQPGKPPNASQ